MEAREIHETLANAVRVRRIGDGFRVSTHCLYPSNTAVSVTIRGDISEFVLSDDGGAALEISGAGLAEAVSDRQIKALLRSQGLNISGGAISSPPVPFEAIPAALMLVANASKEIADWGVEHLRFGPRRDFKKDLAELLDKHFHDNLKHDAPIVGFSNKSHKFNHVVYLKHDRKLLIDPAVNDASSINSRVVANLDVRMSNDPSILQLIVFDDSLNWSSSDLKLLEVGAQTVPFSQAERAIGRLAA